VNDPTGQCTGGANDGGAANDGSVNDAGRAPARRSDGGGGCSAARAGRDRGLGGGSAVPFLGLAILRRARASARQKKTRSRG
jgi:hypothetical protein